jgi:hypothetical protein
MLFCIQPYYNLTFVIISYIIILFLHLLSTNHKCTQPCYFPLLLKPVAQKLKKIWSTLIWSSRGAIATSRLPMELCYLSAAIFRECLTSSFVRHYSCNKYIILIHCLFYIHFLYVICVNLIPGHTNHEDLIWS